MDVSCFGTFQGDAGHSLRQQSVLRGITCNSIDDRIHGLLTMQGDKEGDGSCAPDGDKPRPTQCVIPNRIIVIWII